MFSMFGLTRAICKRNKTLCSISTYVNNCGRDNVQCFIYGENDILTGQCMVNWP